MRYLLALCLLALPLIGAAEIYKWRDTEGRWHFSDEPRAGAEPVTLPPATVYEAPPLARTQPPAAPQPAPEREAAYQAAAIATPGPEATIRNATGEVSVRVALDPGLRQGHQVRLILDGDPVGEPVPTTNFTLRNVYRGAHQVAAEVVSPDGRVLTRTGVQTFYMHRPSALR
jgi:hypothetical protein